METFHAHIYYEQSTFEKAKTLVDKAYDQEGVTVGRMHEKPVGPHPVWSCQLLFHREQLTNMMIWFLVLIFGRFYLGSGWYLRAGAISNW